ncbi:hypothetical protein [Capnocytophaga sp. oral taxon 323]|uniref:hypothetical protein n=1 Tax=Capnocytophaga sp. oral taxon 323 TaxID=1705617 RepID=UPI0012FC81C0|nr:hypothetical protein [Capnocytophaga sp. oral taxon 323]
MVNFGEAYRKDEQKTNKRRTKNEQRTNKRRCEPHEQMRERRIKDGAIRMGR